MSRRVVIVGAGPGGLAAALLLTRAGADVTVLERLPAVGGRSGTLAADGFRFDKGATFFLYPRILAEILDACGFTLEDEIELMRLEPMYDLVFEGGGRIRATADPAAMAREIERFSAEDAAALPRFMADNRAKLKAFQPVLQTPFHDIRGLLRPDTLKALPLLRPHASIDADLARYFKDPRVRLAFSFQSKYLGMSPFKCPSLFTILAFMEYEYGVFHPRGGCGGLMDTLAHLARRMGARVRTGEPVEEILFNGRRAVGVRTPEGEYRSDALVINADFAATMTRLVPDRLRRRWKDARLARKKYSCSTFMMYLGIEGHLDRLAHHTILLARDYARNLAEIEAGRTPPTAPSLYVQNACATEPGRAPADASALYVLVPVSNETGAIDWDRERAGFRARILKRLELLGVEDIDRRVRFEKTVTPQDWQRERIYRGATFNLTHSMRQMLHNRPRNRFEDLERVYLVGGGTHPGSGLPVIFESARITAGLLADDLGLEPVAPAVQA